MHLTTLDHEQEVGALDGARARWWEAALAAVLFACLAFWHRPRRRRTVERGFTLIEFLVASAIIVLLAGATLPALARAYRGAVARASWSVHCTQARHAEVDNLERPATASRFVEMTTDQAFRRFYPQYRSYADVPRDTVRYWRGKRDQISAEDEAVKPNP